MKKIIPLQGQINESFCHRKNFVSKVSFASCPRRKFSIAIFVNCIEKILLWGHFHSIMELLLSNYLWHFLIIEKKICFFFSHKVQQSLLSCYMLTSKCPSIPNATDWIGVDLKVSMNQSHQPSHARVASRSFQSAIYTSPIGGWTSMLGHINLQLMEELGYSKRTYRQLHNYE